MLRLKMIKEGLPVFSQSEEDEFIVALAQGYIQDQIDKIQAGVEKVAKEKELIAKYLKTEIPDLIKKGQEGDGYALYRLGLIIESQILEPGFSQAASPENRERAAILFELAGANGYMKGYKHLARKYEERLMEKEKEKAYLYYDKIRTIDTEAGDKYDRYLSKQYFSDAKSKEIKLKAKAGDEVALFKLGLANIHAKPKFGLPYLEQSASKGNADAAYHIAQYYRGKGNRKEAGKWFLKAIDMHKMLLNSGNHLSAYKISQIHYIMFFNKLVPSLSEDREKYLKMAADNGVIYGMAKLGETYYRQKKYNLAVPYLEKTVELAPSSDCSCNMRDLPLEMGNGSISVGYVQSILFLGEIYAEGLEVEKDLQKAANYFTKSGSYSRFKKYGIPVPKGKIGARLHSTSPFSIHEMVSKNTTSTVKIVFGWTTWCPPCLGMMTDLMELRKQYNGQLEVYFVSFDGREKLPEITRVMDIVGVDFWAGFTSPDDDPKMAQYFDNWKAGFPSTMIINRSNKGTMHLYGRVSKEELNSKIRRISSIP